MSKRKILFSDKAHSILKKMIFDHKISSKEPLSELKLAATLRMSRTPIREALRQLKAEGILVSYNNKGYFINIPSLKEIRESYEIRIILEGAAANLAAQRINLNDLEKFEKQFLDFKETLSDGKNQISTGEQNDTNFRKEYDYIEVSRMFHFLIIESTGNEKMKELIEKIYEQQLISRTFSFRKRRKESVDEHLQIINALRERDGEKSRTYMEKHLKDSYDVLVKIYE